jgi:uncharacterized protein (TIGR03435 family)
VNMLGLINVLSGTLGSPVLDKTELTGLYSFKLEFTDPRFQRPGNSSGLPVDSAPDIFTACKSSSDSGLRPGKARWKCWSSITPKRHRRISVNST